MNALGERILEQRRVAVERRREERLARHEQQHELWSRRELRPVRLGRELVDVLAQVRRVRGQALLADCVIGGLVGLEVRRQRDLRVDDDALAANQAHHQIRTEHAVRRGDAGLLVEVAPVGHAGVLDASLQLKLAPPAACLRLAQCAD